MKVSKFYNKILREIINKMFSFCQILGLHITPVHFYQPIPDTRRLKETLWTSKSDLTGVEMNERKQIELLSLFKSRFKDEYESFPKDKTSVPHQYYLNNGGFGPVSGEILWCMIRYFKPKKIIEIGSGNSTYLSTQAVLKNKEENGKTAEFITVEPYPCKIIQEGFPGLTKLIKKEVQDVNLDEFDKLEENDILFIDSSHVLKIGGDVQYEYLKILPRINKGVIIHIHDVFFPVEYPKRWVLQEHRFWTEQYLLISFLMFNKDFEILWAGSYMNLNYSNLLKDAFNSYDKNTSWSSSFWIRRK